MDKFPEIITESEIPNATALRKQAEEFTRGEKARSPENLEAMSAEKVLRLLHELRVHQIELEMQNEELLRVHAKLDAECTRYSDLYDLAPVGYVTVNEKDLILEANLTAAALLGVTRGALITQSLTRFIFSEDQDIYYLHRKQLFETIDLQVCKLRMVKKGGTSFWARLVATAVQTADGTPVCRIIINYINVHKLQTDERELTARLILLVNTPGDFRKNMSDLTAALQGWSGCEAVGIRLRDGDDYPYYMARGFPPEFVQAENQLCAYGPDGKILRDGSGNPIFECMCGNILCGRFDPAKPFFTTNGSFWSNNTTALLANTTEADRQARTRNRCNGEGYESVALIPLRTDNQVFGLLQFNDRCMNRFTPDLIAHFERIADNLAISLSRRQATEMLRETSDYLNRLIDYANSPIITWDTGFRITRFNRAFERLTGYTADAVMGQELFVLFPETSRNKSLNNIKATSLGEYWESVDLPIRRKDGLIRIVLWNSANVYAQDCKTLLATIAQGQDITERRQAEEELKQALESLKRSFSTTIQVMVSAIEARDPYTSGHQNRSAHIALAIATEMGLSQEMLEAIRMAAPIHDIGKLSIPSEILSKPGKLSEIEYSLIKEHARTGFEILKDVEYPWPLAQIVYQHHERMNGSGYPRNLKGAGILMEARILAVADVVESMSSHRPYRPALGINAALEEIENNKETLYDTDVADACLRLFREKGFKLEGE